MEVDYKALYQNMLAASESAIEALDAQQPEFAKTILIDSERLCEELYLSMTEEAEPD